jgi:uncharacterized protein YqgQ
MSVKVIDPKDKIKTQLIHLKSLQKDGLLPKEVYQRAATIATKKYLSSSNNSFDNSTTVRDDVAEQRRRRKLESREVLWLFGLPLLALMVSLICGLVLIDWVLGVDRPRIIDYILHPISTCSTHRTGRIEL